MNARCGRILTKSLELISGHPGAGVLAFLLGGPCAERQQMFGPSMQALELADTHDF